MKVTVTPRDRNQPHRSGHGHHDLRVNGVLIGLISPTGAIAIFDPATPDGSPEGTLVWSSSPTVGAASISNHQEEQK